MKLAEYEGSEQQAPVIVSVVEEGQCIVDKQFLKPFIKSETNENIVGDICEAGEK